MSQYAISDLFLILCRALVQINFEYSYLKECNRIFIPNRVWLCNEYEIYFLKWCVIEIWFMAYKSYYNATLLKVQSDLLMAMDTYGVTHPAWFICSIWYYRPYILPQRLHESAIRDAALDWFRSYLSQQRQSVVINDTRSSYRNLSFGVPQGPVLGPILFTMYTIPLGAVVQ